MNDAQTILEKREANQPFTRKRLVFPPVREDDECDCEDHDEDDDNER